MTTSTSTSTPNTSRRRNRRGEGGRLRDDIVQAATRLLQEHGAEDAVTLRAVAREAGIAAPSIYPHFPNAAAIIAAVVAETFDALTAALRASREGIEDPVQRLMAQCYGYLRFAEEQPGLYRVLFARARGTGQVVAASSSNSDADGETVIDDVAVVPAGTAAFAILVEAIVGCVRAGRSSSRDPFLDAAALWSALHGYIALRAAAGRFPWPDEPVMVEAMVIGQARLDMTHP